MDAEPRSRLRWLLAPVPMAVVAVAVLRIAGFVGIGVMDHGLNFDEGAYLSAAELLVDGEVMYRDYIAVHPPVLFYALVPVTWLPDAAVFGAARTLMVLVALASIALAGRLAARHLRPWPAAAVVVAYGIAPDALVAGRSVVTETLVNLLCIVAALAWLPAGQPDDRAADRRAVLAGVAFGLACATKLLALPMLLAIVASAAPGRRRGDLARFGLGAVAAFGAVTLPMALRAPAEFFEQVVWFQANRPVPTAPLLSLDRAQRLVPGIFSLQHLQNVLFPLAGLAVVWGVAVERGVVGRFARFAVVWFASASAAMYLGRMHDGQYNAHLAVPAALALGWGLDRGFAWLRAREAVGPAAARRVGMARVAIVSTLVVLALLTVRMDRALELTRDPTAAQVASFVRQHDGCIFSFEPAWLLVGERLPDVDRFGRIATDPYVGLLIEAMAAGEGDQQFESPASERVVREAIERCPTVILGSRGRWHLGGQVTWFYEHHRPVASTSTGVDVWVRIDPDAPPAGAQPPTGSVDTSPSGDTTTSRGSTKLER